MKRLPKLESLFSKEVLRELALALNEIGPISPKYDKKCETWVFAHKLYPSVEYSGDSTEEVMAGYPYYLAEFIKHRLAGKIHAFDLVKTKGRGGARPGSGRPKKGAMRRKYLPEDIALWLETEENLEKVRKLMNQ